MEVGKKEDMMCDELNFRIARLMDERGLKPYPFAKSNGIASSTMTSIYKGKVKFEGISISTFLKIAHGLGMTAEQLYYGEGDVAGDSQPLSSDEQSIVDGYRAMDERDKHDVRAMVGWKVERIESDAREKKTAL